LKVRVAIDAKTRTVAIVHQFVDGMWTKFGDDEDAYVHGPIDDEPEDVVSCPGQYGMRWRDAIPCSWR
jgi:hypothetical protein